MELLTASLDEEFIELVNATLGRWMPARVRNMSYSDYFNVMCPLMCSEAVCDYFKKLGLLRQPLSPAARTKKKIGWLRVPKKGGCSVWRMKHSNMKPPHRAPPRNMEHGARRNKSSQQRSRPSDPYWRRRHPTPWTTTPRTAPYATPPQPPHRASS